MFARPVARIVEHCRWRRPATERPIVANICPQTGRVGLAPGEHRNGGVVTVNAFGGENVRLKTLEDREESTPTQAPTWSAKVDRLNGRPLWHSARPAC